MPFSINTNVSSYAALESLSQTQTELQKTQKQISTGYRVADAQDDGGAYAIAQGVRADVQALTTVNQQLGNAQGLLTTTTNSLNTISNALTQAKGLLVDIADKSNSSSQTSQYIQSFQTLVASVADAVDGSTYNGLTLLGKASGAVAGTSLAVINNEAGSTHTLSAEDNSGTANALAALIGATFTRNAGGTDTFTAPASISAAQSAASSALASGGGTGTLGSLQTSVSNQLNQAGADSNYLSNQITFNTNKINSLNTGLGALVDADLSQESALLSSLQVKQQLGTQALSIANSAPQSLLSLFK